MNDKSMSHSGYLTDYWTTQDYLRFEDFRPALEKIITQAQTPITVGVFGPWGSGKTSLLKMLEAHIKERGRSGWRTVWFTAWKYDQREALWRALILRVIDALYPQSGGERLAYDELTPEQQALVDELDRLQESVYRPLDWQELGEWTVDWFQLLKEGGKGAAKLASIFLPGVDLLKKAVDALTDDPKAGENFEEALGAFKREVRSYHREQLRFMEQFEKKFREVLKMEAALGEDGRLIVFVDDLDRCLPEQAVEVLEAIKLFLEVKGTVFVLGMDQTVVERGVEAHYGALFQKAGLPRETLPINGETYLQKIVQIPFHLPPLATEDLETYIEKLDEKLPSHARLDERTRKVFALGLYPNPRQVKRAINIFRLLKTIALTREENGSLPEEIVAWPLLAKTVVIQMQYAELYQQWRQWPTLIATLEEEFARQPLQERAVVRGLEKSGEGETEKQETSTGGLLAAYLSPDNRLKYVLLERMLLYPEEKDVGSRQERARFSGLGREKLAIYTRLAGVVESDAQTESAQEAATLPAGILKDILSGDMALVKDAVARIKEEDVQAWRERLMQILESPQSSVKERYGAGTALSILGDPRDFDELVTVPAGEFTMGSMDEDRWARDDEKPQHNVFVDAFFISKYPVTNAQYATFVEATGHKPPKHWRGDAPPPELRNHPVVNVSWHDALTYCQWLKEKTGRPYRLPTEAEWEKAARGTDARIYPWGNDFSPEKCNVYETGIRGTSPVGMFPDGTSPYGCLDMSGNVWEWTLSKYKSYPYKSDDGRENIDKSNAHRVLRGGSFGLDRRRARCTHRLNYRSFNLKIYFGFRIVVPNI